MKTSFGEMEHILKLRGQVVAEYLKFKSSGRKHKHKEYESFFVLSGHGQVISGDATHQVSPGSLVTIPPGTEHWMIPEGDTELEGLLWYHATPLKSYAE